MSTIALIAMNTLKLSTTILSDYLRCGILIKLQLEQQTCSDTVMTMLASCMHYDKDDFSANGKDTIVAKDPSIPFGDAWELSPLDIAKTNNLYSCGT